MPIMMYSTVQTGPKAESGGVSLLFLRVLYQPCRREEEFFLSFFLRLESKNVGEWQSIQTGKNSSLTFTSPAMDIPILAPANTGPATAT